jgi:hypothetical protein
MLDLAHRGPWAFMLRVSDMEKIGLVRNYFTETKNSHEPHFGLTLTAYGGKCISIRKPLYKYRMVVNAHSQHETFERFYNHFNGYFDLFKVSIDKLDDKIFDDEFKTRYKKFADVGKYLWIVKNGRYKKGACPEKYYCKFYEAVNEYFGTDFKRADFLDKPDDLFAALLALYRGYEPQKPTPGAKVIAYGALGKAAHATLKELMNTPFEPTEYQDLNGDPDGVVKPPCFDGLTADDMVFVIPKKLQQDGFLKDSVFKTLYYSDFYYLICYIKSRKYFKNEWEAK